MRTWFFAVLLAAPVAASPQWSVECEKNIADLIERKLTKDNRAREIYDKFLEAALGEQEAAKAKKAREEAQSASQRLADLDIRLRNLTDDQKTMRATLQDERQKVLEKSRSAEGILRDAGLTAGKNEDLKARVTKSAKAEGLEVDWVLGFAEFKYKVHVDEAHQRSQARTLILAPDGAKAGTYAIYSIGDRVEMLGEKLFMAHVVPACEKDLGRPSLSPEARDYARSVLNGGATPAPAPAPVEVAR